MRAYILSLAALVGSSFAAQWHQARSLPDGPYSGVVHANGSTTMKSLDSGAEFFFDLDNTSDEQLKRSDAVLEKRFTSCWGYQLDHGGVDEGVVALKNWAGNNGQTLTSGDSTHYYGFNRKGVYVYYCINAPHSQGNLDIKDINFALRNMDSACPRYDASYYQWDGSAELVGKCRSGTAVCLG